MLKYLFSVIVPIYNVEEYLPECLESILNQEFKDFEIIAVDDGSTDSSGNIIDDYARKDSRIKPVHKENGGLVSARKAATAIASGEYIINVDSDDFIDSKMLSDIYNIIKTTRADMVCFGYCKYEGSVKECDRPAFDEGLYSGTNAEQIFSSVLFSPDNRFYTFGVHPSLCTKAIKRELYVKYQEMADNSVSMGEDLMVSLPSILEAERIYISHGCYYYYRVNDVSMTHKYNEKYIKELFDLLKYFQGINLLNSSKLRSQFDAYIYGRLYSLLISECEDLKSPISAIKKLNAIYKNVIPFLSREKHKSQNKKYNFVKFMLDKKCWIYIWLNSKRVKRKRNK